MKNCKNNTTDTQEKNFEFPTPDDLADAIIDDLLATVKTNGRIINRRILKDSVINGFAKFELVSVDENNSEEVEQGAPIDPIIARKEIIDAVTNSIFESFDILAIPKKPLATMVATNAALAAEETFSKYFIR